MRNSLKVLAALLALSPLAGQADPLLAIDIQPIQVCDDGGANCANAALELFEAIGDKIWAQAGIDLNFLSWMNVNDSSVLNAANFAATPANANPNIVNVWFIQSLADCGGSGSPATLFGCGGGNRFSVTDLVFSFNGGIGRLDTISHEIGHVLGLGHNDFGAGGGDNLMTNGSDRTVPSSIADINPDGLGLSKLTQDQIDQARMSGVLYAVPEPGTLALFFLGLILIVLARRRGYRQPLKLNTCDPYGYSTA